MVQREVGGHHIKGIISESQNGQLGDAEISQQQRLRGELHHPRLGINSADPGTPRARPRSDVP